MFQITATARNAERIINAISVKIRKLNHLFMAPTKQSGCAYYCIYNMNLILIFLLFSVCPFALHL